MKRLIEMEAFANVIDYDGFTGAARQMGLSKSAVSKHVANLESRLGARLLNRTTRRVGPTEIGVAYYDRARRVLSEAVDADALVRSMHDEPAGLLRLSIAAELGTHVVSPVINEFLNQNAAVQIDMELSNRAADLITEKFDLAIRVGDLPDSTLMRRKLAESTVHLVASPAYLERYGNPAGLSDLKAHKLLRYKDSSNGSPCKLKLKTGHDRTIKSTASLRANDGQSLLAATKSGLGIAVLPSYVCSKALLEGDIIEVLPDTDLMPQTIFAVYPSAQFVQPKTRAFIDHLVGSFSDMGPKNWI